MITGHVLRQIARKGGRIHRISYPGTAAIKPYALHFATKAQADKSFRDTEANWPTVAATVTRDTPLASEMDLNAFMLM